MMRKFAFIFALLVMTVIVASAQTPPAAPAAGSAAPTFKLTTNVGKEASLADFKGQWVVLYFYPKDFTSGCTLAARNFQRDIAKYQAAHAVILGVSTDTADSHKDFCAKEGLNFKLLADIGGTVSEQYGSIMLHEGVKYSARNTFIIDPTEKIAKGFMKVST